jgi:hypothetical protein
MSISTTVDYTPEEQLAARIIASLIYPDFPGGPDLETDAARLGLYAGAVNGCRDPYEMATITMPLDGKLRDCPGDAAMAWEGLRQISSSMRPYARLEPLIRALGSEIQGTQAIRQNGHTNGMTLPTPEPTFDARVCLLPSVQQATTESQERQRLALSPQRRCAYLLVGRRRLHAPREASKGPRSGRRRNLSANHHTAH